MPTTTPPLKRPSAGGRLRRLLASLRPPDRAGPLPVQTGFPTSLADLVVKNHGRLKKPRRRHRAAAPAPPPAVSSPAAAAAEEEPAPRRIRPELSVAQHPDDPAVPVPVPAGPKGAGFSIRPELLAVGGVLALALLVIWSKRLVAAATLASVALFWIESARSPAASRRRPSPETKGEEPDSRGRGFVSPIREAESPAETPRPSCAESDTGSEVSSTLWAADLAGDDVDSDSITPKRKEKRRSLRKLLARKLQNSKRPKDKEDRDSRHSGESAHTGAGEVSAPEPEVAVAPADETAPPPEAIAEARCHRRRGGALPLAAFVPIILIGLVAGMLPAVALTVLCAVFFTSVERTPDGHGRSDPR